MSTLAIYSTGAVCSLGVCNLGTSAPGVAYNTVIRQLTYLLTMFSVPQCLLFNLGIFVPGVMYSRVFQFDKENQVFRTTLEGQTKCLKFGGQTLAVFLITLQ